MQQTSLLDMLLSLFSAFLHSWQSDWWLRSLPYLLFHLAGTWLAIVGWKRHRAPGFLLLLAGASIGLVSNLLWLADRSPVLNIHKPPSNFYEIIHQLGIVAMVFTTAGIWHFVYRARFAPPEPTPQ